MKVIYMHYALFNNHNNSKKQVMVKIIVELTFFYVFQNQEQILKNLQIKQFIIRKKIKSQVLYKNKHMFKNK